jgi:hypothetical protein
MEVHLERVCGKPRHRYPWEQPKEVLRIYELRAQSADPQEACMAVVDEDVAASVKPSVKASASSVAEGEGRAPESLEDVVMRRQGSAT